MKSAVQAVGLSLAMTTGVAAQSTIHVDPNCGDDAWTGLSEVCDAPDGPKRTIRAALDVVESGGTVLLGDGAYAGEGNYDLDVLTDDITIASAGGRDACVIMIPTEAEYTIRASSSAIGNVRLNGLTFQGESSSKAIGVRLLGASSSSILSGDIIDCVFTNCGAGFSDNGGALFAEFADLTLDGCTFSLNYDGHFTLYDSDITIRGCEFLEGRPADPITEIERSTVLMEDCIFADGTSSCRGGAFQLRDCATVIRRSRFERNVAWTCGAGSGGEAGAIDLINGQCRIENSSFTDNIAQSGFDGPGIGGAIDTTNCDLTLVSTEFSGNRTGLGGAIAIAGGSLIIDDSVFEANRADSGGAIWGTPNSLILKSTILHSNAAVPSSSPAASGGAIDVASTVSMLVSNCIFLNNDAYGYYDQGGGAIRLGSVVDGLITNCTIVGGTVSEDIECYGPALYLIGDCNLTLANCVIWDNDHPLEGMGAIALQDNASLTVAYSLLENGIDSIDLVDPETTLTWLAGNLDADPRFVDREGGDLRLLPNSPAIDAGDNEALPADVTTDLDGLPRFHNDLGTPDTGAPTPDRPFVTDMGCYEFQGASFGVAGAWPARAGEINEIAVVGAEPGETVHLLAALADGATVIPQCPEIVLDLDSPVYLGSRVANAMGQARFSVDVPNRAVGRNVRFQALAYPACAASNLRIVPFN